MKQQSLITGQWLGIDKIKKEERHKRYNETKKRAYKRHRETVIEIYGGKCKCCGETEEIFLCIDHINGGGNQHRKQITGHNSGSILIWLKKNNYPKDMFQLLCYNCNNAKTKLGKCPHQKKISETA